MGRYVSSTPETTAYYGIRDVLPTYGTGGFRYYGTSGTFVVPPGVTQVRVTALGGGGGGAAGVFNCGSRWQLSSSGGGGAGYVVATTTVTPGCVCTVTVGAGGTHYGYIPCCCDPNYLNGGSGGTSQFGTAICATGGGGGCAINTANPLGGCAGCFVVSSGTIVVGRCGNKGCDGCCTSASNQGYPCYGGASGSPIGGGGTGPWPGTGGSDVYNCKSFAGDSLSEGEIAAKFLNVVRWPGETILSTVRTQGSVAGVPAGFPSTYPGCTGGVGCYIASVYGAAAIYSCNASAACCVCPNGCYYSCLSACCWGAAGCGGGGSSGRPWPQVVNGGYAPCCYGCPLVGGCPGNGFLVVEY